MNNTIQNLQERLKETSILETKGEIKRDEANIRYNEIIETLNEGLPKDIQNISEELAVLLSDAHNIRGVNHRMLREYNKATTDYETALILGPKNEQKALALVNTADICRVGDSDFPSAHHFLDEALTYAGNRTPMHAKALDQRGLVFFAQEDYNSAIHTHQNAKEIYQVLLKNNENNEDLQRGLGHTLLHLGVDHITSGSLNTLENTYEDQLTALSIFEGLEDQHGIYLSVSNIGEISKIKGNHKEAITQYEKALEIVERTEYGRAVTVLSLYLAEAHLRIGESIKSVGYLKRFVKGVKENEATPYDLEIWKERINDTKRLYSSAGPEIEGLNEIGSL